MATQMIIRMPDELKNQVSKLAKAEGKNTSAIVRSLLEKYVKERDMDSYVDTLWDTIGSAMKSQGTTRADIDQAIQKARSRK
jgi:metal-responsive CopG/Arc/MetJ family transcriptional regulator